MTTIEFTWCEEKQMLSKQMLELLRHTIINAVQEKIMKNDESNISKLCEEANKMGLSEEVTYILSNHILDTNSESTCAGLRELIRQNTKPNN